MHVSTSKIASARASESTYSRRANLSSAETVTIVMEYARAEAPVACIEGSMGRAVRCDVHPRSKCSESFTASFMLCSMLNGLPGHETMAIVDKQSLSLNLVSPAGSGQSISECQAWKTVVACPETMARPKEFARRPRQLRRMCALSCESQMTTSNRLVETSRAIGWP